MRIIIDVELFKRFDALDGFKRDYGDQLVYKIKGVLNKFARKRLIGIGNIKVEK